MTISMIYHCPFPFSDKPLGDKIRPIKMLEAFKECGFEVEEIVGTKKERIEAFDRIRKEIKAGKKFDFVYSESSTKPIFLANGYKDASFIDYSFFSYMKKNKIPVGLYYRDLHWRFKDLTYISESTQVLTKNTRFLKLFIISMLHYLDWYYYQKYIDCLFLPSLSMGDYLPVKWAGIKIFALPPGCDLQKDSIVKPDNSNLSLKLFYVGSIKPPLYDLSNIIKNIKEINHVFLTICCRFDDFKKVTSDYYNQLINNRQIKITHGQGRELDKYYWDADIFVIMLGDHPYWQFAAPVKLFECLGYGLPIVTMEGTEVAKIVKEEDLGWVVSSYEEFNNLLYRLLENKALISEKRRNIRRVRNKHKWFERAKFTADVMMNKLL